MTHYLPYLTLLGSVVSFSFVIWKYLDTRRRELNQQRFEQFHRVFLWVSGVDESGRKLVNTQQALAVYELTQFPEYRHMTLPILEYYLTETQDESDGSLFRRSLLAAHAHLKPQPATT